MYQEFRMYVLLSLLSPQRHGTEQTRPQTKQVDHANRLAARRGLSHRASFLVADGMDLPFIPGRCV
jgi:hypothetical protein